MKSIRLFFVALSLFSGSPGNANGLSQRFKEIEISKIFSYIPKILSYENLELAEKVVHRVEILSLAGKIFDYNSPIPAYLGASSVLAQGIVGTLSTVLSACELWNGHFHDKNKFAVHQFWNGTHSALLGYVAFALCRALEGENLAKAFALEGLSASILYSGLGFNCFAASGSTALAILFYNDTIWNGFQFMKGVLCTQKSILPLIPSDPEVTSLEIASHHLSMNFYVMSV